MRIYNDVFTSADQVTVLIFEHEFHEYCAISMIKIIWYTTESVFIIHSNVVLPPKLICSASVRPCSYFITTDINIQHLVKCFSKNIAIYFYTLGGWSTATNLFADKFNNIIRNDNYYKNLCTFKNTLVCYHTPMAVKTYLFLLFDPISNIHKNQLNHIEIDSHENDLCKNHVRFGWSVTKNLIEKLQTVRINLLLF